MTDMLENSELILRYCDKGLQVFPVHGIDERGLCTCGVEWCGNQGKHPRVFGGHKAATDNRKKIMKWWTQWPDANVGIRTGRESAIFVLDVDGSVGWDSLRTLEDAHSKLPDTWKCRTGGGGGHQYFKHPGNIKIRCSHSHVGEKLDIKGDGGYVVAPPSLHVTGDRYEWEPGFSPHDALLAEAPEWLINLITARKKKRPSEGAGTLIEGVASDGLIYKSRPSRNVTLFNMACHMRDKGLSHEYIRLTIELWNLHRCVPPLRESKVQALLDSALGYPLRPSWQPKLSEGSERVYKFLVEKSLGSGFCKVTRGEIAAATAMSPRNVSKRLRQLEQFGYLHVQPVKGDTSIYYPVFPELSTTHELPMNSLHPICVFDFSRTEEQEHVKGKEVLSSEKIVNCSRLDLIGHELTGNHIMMETNSIIN